MRLGIWIALAGVAVAAGFAGCGSLGKHYDENLPEPAPVLASAGVMASISVESKPTGAMISLNGAQVGPSPATIRLELDAAGAFQQGVEITADFSVVSPVRGVSHTVTAKYNRGDASPRLLVLARPADGGIQNVGNILLKR